MNMTYSRQNIYYLLISLTVFILTILSCKGDCIEIQVPYTVEEPYEAIDTQEVVLPYHIEGVEWERVMGSTILKTKPRIESYSYLTNTGEKGGVFELQHTFITEEEKEKVVLSKAKYIQAGETVKFELSGDLHYYEKVEFNEYKVIPPTVNIQQKTTKMRKLTKFRKCNSCDENCK